MNIISSFNQCPEFTFRYRAQDTDCLKVTLTHNHNALTSSKHLNPGLRKRDVVLTYPAQDHCSGIRFFSWCLIPTLSVTRGFIIAVFSPSVSSSSIFIDLHNIGRVPKVAKGLVRPCAGGSSVHRNNEASLCACGAEIRIAPHHRAKGIFFCGF